MIFNKQKLTTRMQKRISWLLILTPFSCAFAECPGRSVEALDRTNYAIVTSCYNAVARCDQISEDFRGDSSSVTLEDLISSCKGGGLVFLKSMVKGFEALTNSTLGEFDRNRANCPPVDLSTPDTVQATQPIADACNQAAAVGALAHVTGNLTWDSLRAIVIFDKKLYWDRNPQEAIDGYLGTHLGYWHCLNHNGKIKIACEFVTALGINVGAAAAAAGGGAPVAESVIESGATRIIEKSLAPVEDLEAAGVAKQIAERNPLVDPKIRPLAGDSTRIYRSTVNVTTTPANDNPAILDLIKEMAGKDPKSSLTLIDEDRLREAIIQQYQRGAKLII